MTGLWRRVSVREVSHGVVIQGSLIELCVSIGEESVVVLVGMEEAVVLSIDAKICHLSVGVIIILLIIC